MSLQYQWICACQCVCVCVCLCICVCVCVCVSVSSPWPQHACMLQLTLIQVRYVQPPFILPQVLNAPPESVGVLSAGGTHFLKVTLGHLCQALPCKNDGSIEHETRHADQIYILQVPMLTQQKTKIHEYKRNINTHTVNVILWRGHKCISASSVTTGCICLATLDYSSDFPFRLGRASVYNQS